MDRMVIYLAEPRASQPPFIFWVLFAVLVLGPSSGEVDSPFQTQRHARAGPVSVRFRLLPIDLCIVVRLNKIRLSTDAFNWTEDRVALAARGSNSHRASIRELNPCSDSLRVSRVLPGIEYCASRFLSLLCPSLAVDANNEKVEGFVQLATELGTEYECVCS